MKWNEKMWFAFLGAALCCFFFGLGQQPVPAIPNNCTQEACEDAYGWWFALGLNGNPTTYSAQVLNTVWNNGFPPGSNTTTGIANIFLQAPNGKKAPAPFNPAQQYTGYTWPNNLATCAPPPGGGWQSPQVVTPNGTPPVLQGPSPRVHCT